MLDSMYNRSMLPSSIVSNMTAARQAVVLAIVHVFELLSAGDGSDIVLRYHEPSARLSFFSNKKAALDKLSVVAKDEVKWSRFEGKMSEIRARDKYFVSEELASAEVCCRRAYRLRIWLDHICQHEPVSAYVSSVSLARV